MPAGGNPSPQRALQLWAASRRTSYKTCVVPPAGPGIRESEFLAYRSPTVSVAPPVPELYSLTLNSCFTRRIVVARAVEIYDITGAGTL